MPPLSRCILAVVAVLNLFGAAQIHAQNSTALPTTPAIKVDYPDSTSGLEHLVKDVIKAQKADQGERADALLRTMILPEPRNWYDAVFGGDVSEESETLYEKSGQAIPNSLAQFLLSATTRGMNNVVVMRFEKTCDDNSGEDVFGILETRITPVPLYELRLVNGTQFVRLFAFAFVNGGFRFIIPPKLHGNVFGPGRKETPSTTAPGTTSKDGPGEQRSRVGGSVQAARLIHRVQPAYPERARSEHLEGKVEMHALIGKDGSMRKLYVVKGYCSLAAASLEAVRQWKYTPTMLMGEPVEVDTSIQVIFQLRQ